MQSLLLRRPSVKWFHRFLIGSIILSISAVGISALFFARGPFPDPKKVDSLNALYMNQITNQTCGFENSTKTCFDYLLSSCCSDNHYYESCNPQYPWCPISDCPFIYKEDPNCAQMHRDLNQERCLQPPLWTKNVLGMAPFVFVSILWSWYKLRITV